MDASWPYVASAHTNDRSLQTDRSRGLWSHWSVPRRRRIAAAAAAAVDAAASRWRDASDRDSWSSSDAVDDTLGIALPK